MRVLFVDDDQSLCTWVAGALERRGCDVVPATSVAEGLERIEHQDFDVVVSSLNSPTLDGSALFERILVHHPEVPVIVTTASGNLDAAIAAVRAGAYEFVAKPFEVEALELAVNRAAQHRLLREEVQRLRSLTQALPPDFGLIGDSQVMGELRVLIAKLAQIESSVLITGESGTGKEIAARALHDQSRHAQGPFVAIQCAAMPEALLEAELFGRDTGANSGGLGLFERAGGGTLFLDEIGDLPLGLQRKLWNALEQRSVHPVGAMRVPAVDPRLIAATRCDLAFATSEGRFREDLYHRIGAIELPMPPLRARGSDVLTLAQRFVREFALRAGKPVSGLSPGAAERLLAYVWPGNVRELRNCIERAVALTRSGQLTVEDLPERIRSYRSSYVVVASDNPSELVPLEEVERRYILRVLDGVQGNKSLAARILGLDRGTLCRKLERYRGKDAP